MLKRKDLIIFYILILIIAFEIIFIIYKKIYDSNAVPNNACSAAYNCKINEENPEIMYCDYNDWDNNIIKIKCRNTLCEDAYDCEEDENNLNILNCKYIRNNSEENIKCPNSEVYYD